MRTWAKYLAVIAAMAMLSPSQARAADGIALLVGASKYDKRPLTGPPRDVQEMYAVLRKRNFAAEDITVVADGLPPEFKTKTQATLPSKANILAGFKQVQERARRIVGSGGEAPFVYIHFSGHGVQLYQEQNAVRPEPDGRDEAFVTTDVKSLFEPENSTAAMQQGYLIDDEIERELAAIRKTGAFIWLVIDSCNSGDMKRGATDEFSERAFSNTPLGKPVANTGAGARRGESAGGQLDFADDDGIVAFYAVRPDQLAIEKKVPNTAAGAVMGVFTYALTRALASVPRGSYDQLARAIGQIYSTELGGTAPQPFYQGSLQKAVFEGREVEPVWVAKKDGSDTLTVDAGALQNLSSGSIVALLRPGNYEPGKPLSEQPVVAYASIREAGLTRSKADPIAFGGKTVGDFSTLGPEMEAVVADRQVTHRLRVAAPPPQDMAGAEGKQATRLIEAYKQRQLDNKSNRIALEWTSSDQPADVHLRVGEGRLWMLDAFGDWRIEGDRRSPSVALAGEDSLDVFGSNLWKRARVVNLQQLVGAMISDRNTVSGDIGDNELSVKLYVLYDRSPPVERAKGDKRSCPAVPTRSIPAEAKLLDANVPDLSHCDVIYIELENKSPNRIDLTLLYLDGEGAVASFEPAGDPRLLRGESRGPRIVPIQIATRDPSSGKALAIGIEQLIVIGVKQDGTNPAPTTFGQLAQSGLESTRGNASFGTRGASSGGAFAQTLLASMLALEGTRAGVPPKSVELENVTARSFRWNVRANDSGS